MRFEFLSTPKIIFGPGSINSLIDHIVDYGKSIFIVSNGPEHITERLLNILNLQGITTQVVQIYREPNVDLLVKLAETARRFSPDVVIGIGGGSAIDSAKVLAALLSNPGELLDYLEVIGANQPLRNPSIPLIAIPTTAGTGSEVTRNAVLDSQAHQVKVSLRSHYLVPRLALIDPELTLSIPPLITAYTGLDALTQLIEPFTSNSPNPMTDAFCLEGIKLISQSIYQVYNDGSNLHARENMSLASLFSGLSLANSRLGAVHGFAGPLGGELSAPHGAIVAALLANVLEMNISALHQQAPDHPSLIRYSTVAKLLTGDSDASIESSIKWVREFCQHAEIPPLSSYGLSDESLDRIVHKAMNASSMKGNPIILSEDQLRSILQRSM